MNEQTDWGAKARALLSERGIAVDETAAFELLDESQLTMPDPKPLFDRLIEAAMKVCDAHGDGAAAREDMKRECEALSPRLQADLLDHFRGNRVDLSRDMQEKAGLVAAARASVREELIV